MDTELAVIHAVSCYGKVIAQGRWFMPILNWLEALTMTCMTVVTVCPHCAVYMDAMMSMWLYKKNKMKLYT